MNVFYTSDNHANGNHLFSMLSIAADKTVDAIIIGGDIVPHHLPDAMGIGIAYFFLNMNSHNINKRVTLPIQPEPSLPPLP